MPKIDTFAQIAGASHLLTRPGLQEVLPPRLPERLLESEVGNPAAAFAPAQKLDTAEALTRQLAEERRRWEPFLADLAPPLASPRIVRPVRSFQWRLEEPADRSDFSRVLLGAGAWKEVAVPHYGGPIGQATAYYRASFSVGSEMLEPGAVLLRFGAVDYRAEVWLNGRFLGQHEGLFAPFFFECAEHLRVGENTLVVKVDNDAIYMGNASWGQAESGDKLYGATGLGWDDPELGWHHCPPGFGIWQPVSLEACAPLHIADLWVRPLAGEGRAEAWVEVWSKDRKEQAIGFRYSVYGQNFRAEPVCDHHLVPVSQVIPGMGDLEKPTDHQDVRLNTGPGLNRYVVPLHLPDPRRWSPCEPWLYQIQVRLLDDRQREIDAARRQFGLRSFRMEDAEAPRGRFYLNDEEIRLRGANTMGFEQQDVYRNDLAQLVDDILLAKMAHMNFWRLTQRPVQPEVYDYADRLGLMLQTDLPLFGCMRFSKFAEGVRQAEQMERLIRSHPSSVLISYINEPFPNASGRPHRHLTRSELESFLLACDQAVRFANPERAIKHVDGDYDPPNTSLPDYHCYSGWYNGHGVELGKLHRGHWRPTLAEWNYACGEFGAEGLDSLDLMRRRYPPQWLPPDDGPEAVRWSPDRIPHAQTGKYHYLWFDTPRGPLDWVSQSQRFQAWATRLFTERFRRDNRMVSFAIHLFIDAFPSGWMKAIMDCERRPKPAFFAYREALTPLMANIRTDRWAFSSGEPMRFEFWICNDTRASGDGYILRWQLEQGGRILFAQRTSAKLEAHQSTFQGYFVPKAPAVSARTGFTVRLALFQGAERLHDTSAEFDVFPGISTGERPGAAILGSGPAARLAQELGLPAPTGAPRLFLIDDHALYLSRREAIDRAVTDGAVVVFLELPPGRYRVGTDEVVIEEVTMGSRQFVSRATGHRLVEGFKPDDFRCWFDPSQDCFSPILATYVSAEGWADILTSGNGDWSAPWRRVSAAAQRAQGAGVWRVCQLALAGRVEHNPVAARFALRLVSP